MKPFSFLFFLLLSCSAWAQPKVFYIDDLGMPAETGKSKGYVVLTSGDTLKGYLRNDLTIGQLLTPEQLIIGNLILDFRRFQIQKIAFWTDKEENKQVFPPNQLKAFGFESPAPQLPIELTAPHNASGFVKKEELQKQFSLRKQLNSVLESQADQQRLHDGLVHYEVLTHPETPQVIFFAQRLAEGIITLYFWPEEREFLFKRRTAGSLLVSVPLFVRYDREGRFLQQTFGTCPEVQNRLAKEPELRLSENFIRLAGITNVYCDAAQPPPVTLPESYIVTLQGDTLRGEIEWMLMQQKIQFTDKQGQSQKFAPDQLVAFADVTGYGTATVYESHALPGKSDRKMFCQVLSAGNITLLTNPRAAVTTTTNLKGETSTKVGSYLLKKQGKDLVLMTEASFEALFKEYFTDCQILPDELNRDTALKSFRSIEELVKRYNALCPKHK